MAQSKLCLMTGVRSTEEVEFMQFGTLKLMFMEQVRVCLPHRFEMLSAPTKLPRCSCKYIQSPLCNMHTLPFVQRSEFPPCA